MGIRLDTNSLELIALTPAQLHQWLRDVSNLEKELSCHISTPVGFFRDIVCAQLEFTQKDPQNYLWHSFWLLVRKSDRVAVGSADFKTIPDERGEVEIGYGLDQEFEHNGYMTEAVQAMCSWAMQQEGVLAVTAETELDGAASQRVLIRCGFLEESRAHTVWWKLTPKPAALFEECSISTTE